MSIPGFVIRNALRNKRRAAAQRAQRGGEPFLLVTLHGAAARTHAAAEDADAALRVAVRNKVSLMIRCPQRQLPIIEQMPGVEVRDAVHVVRREVQGRTSRSVRDSSRSSPRS